MRIDIPLAEVILPWRFKDGAVLGDWVQEAGWHEASRVWVVRAADPVSADFFIEAIGRSCDLAERSHNGARRYALATQQVMAMGFEAALAATLGLDPDQPPLERATAVAFEAAVRPHLCFVPPLSEAGPTLRGDVEAFVELVRKLDPLAKLTVMLFDTPTRPLGGRCLDFVDGWPSVNSDLITAPEMRLWPVYLHQRIAWEAGGSIFRSKVIEQAVAAAGVSTGDDTGFEAVLDAQAGRLVEDTQAAEFDTTVTRLMAGEQCDEAVRSAFWQPSHGTGLLPRPWFARAMLQKNLNHPYAEFLRNAIVCLPMAQELLAACSLMETKVRARIRLPPQPDPESPCVDAWQRSLKPGSVERSLFPAAGPSVPTSAWEFASFGEYLTNQVVKSATTRWYHELRILRNHLAHGHHVGWNAVKMTKSLVSRVAGDA